MNAQTAKTALNVGYGVFPIVAGADKFTNLLCTWDKYLSPLARKFLPVKGRTFMKFVGVVEMAVGAAMFVPRLRKIAAYTAGGWLSCIAINLIANKDYDIAARDVWLAIGAVSFAQLLDRRERGLVAGAEQRKLEKVSEQLEVPVALPASRELQSRH